MELSIHIEHKYSYTDYMWNRPYFFLWVSHYKHNEIAKLWGYIR
jgi:hypothetical protein